MSQLPWNSAPALVGVAANEVHLIRISLARIGDDVERLGRLLTPEESVRADRFRFEKDRTAFILRRGALREILGRCLNGSPFLQPFLQNAYGKPFMPPGRHDSDFRFNVSHSAGMALIAVARCRDVGVDIEAIDAGADYDEIADRFFSRREREALRSLPELNRRGAFIACWTCKEAYLKARGTGLALALDQFDVSLPHEGPPRLIETRDDPAEAARWSLRSLAVAPGFSGALAVERRGWRLVNWDYLP